MERNWNQPSEHDHEIFAQPEFNDEDRAEYLDYLREHLGDEHFQQHQNGGCKRFNCDFCHPDPNIGM